MLTSWVKEKLKEGLLDQTTKYTYEKLFCILANEEHDLAKQ